MGRDGGEITECPEIKDKFMFATMQYLHCVVFKSIGVYLPLPRCWLHMEMYNVQYGVPQNQSKS